VGCSGCSPASALGTDDWVHSSVQLAHAWHPQVQEPHPHPHQLQGTDKGTAAYYGEAAAPPLGKPALSSRGTAPRTPRVGIPPGPWCFHLVSLRLFSSTVRLLSAADCAGRDVRNFKFGSPTAIVVQVGSNNNCVGNSVVGSCVKGLAVAAGQTYYIVVDGFDADFGSVQLRLQFSSS
jgi:hypothetical protein